MGIGSGVVTKDSGSLNSKLKKFSNYGTFYIGVYRRVIYVTIDIPLFLIILIHYTFDINLYEVKKF